MRRSRFTEEQIVAIVLESEREQNGERTGSRWEYNTQRPHSSLGYRSPAEIGAEARAAMKSDSRPIESADPETTSDAEVEHIGIAVHAITPEALS